MRKFSKLLAVLLTLCLLFGAITAIVASATDGEATMPSAGDIDPVTVAKKTSASNWNHVAHSTYSADHDIKKFDYIAVDFDFGTANDTFSTVTLTLTLTNTPDKDTKLTDSTQTASGRTVNHRINIKESDGSFYWYMGGSTFKADETKKFSNKTGEYDHFTMVYQITHGNNETFITPHLFYNNTYFGTASEFSLPSTDADGNPYYASFFRLNVGSFKDTGGKLTVDNFKVNYYNKGGQKADDFRNFLQSVEGIPSVTIGNEKYTSAAEAKKALATIADGATVTVDGMDFTDVVVP